MLRSSSSMAVWCRSLPTSRATLRLAAVFSSLVMVLPRWACPAKPVGSPVDGHVGRSGTRDPHPCPRAALTRPRTRARVPHTGGWCGIPGDRRARSGPIPVPRTCDSKRAEGRKHNMYGYAGGIHTTSCVSVIGTDSLTSRDSDDRSRTPESKRSELL